MSTMPMPTGKGNFSSVENGVLIVPTLLSFSLPGPLDSVAREVYIRSQERKLESIKDRLPDQVYLKFRSILRKKRRYTGKRFLSSIKPEVRWFIHHVDMTDDQRKVVLEAFRRINRNLPLSWRQGNLYDRFTRQLDPFTYTGEL